MERYNLDILVYVRLDGHKLGRSKLTQVKPSYIQDMRKIMHHIQKELQSCYQKMQKKHSLDRNQSAPG